MCSCMNPEPHVVARSETYDGIAVELWSDGDITGRLGTYPPGMGHNRDPEVALEASRAVWYNITLYNFGEIPLLITLKRAEVRVLRDRRAGAVNLQALSP